ncbi:phage tail sheath family protein [Kitasatospora sp. NPDC058048]|uniref:phage tail sheath family protein n=1 Tax=Kitasatospora sp. NPDC058048 TaxID=3346313 RepID=UPI0036D86252
MTTPMPGITFMELAGGSRPITGLGTSTAAFLVTGVTNPTDTIEKARYFGWNAFDTAYPVTKKTLTATAYAAVRGFFENGGTDCYVVKLDTTSDATVGTSADVLKGCPDVAIVAAPELPLSDGNKPKVQKILKHCHDMGDRVAVLSLDDSATDPATGTDPRSLAGDSAPFAALYHPWVTVPAPYDPSKNTEVPPVGHLAGIFARVDDERGVFKAPANESLDGVIGLLHAYSPTEIGTYNDKGINCLRTLPGRGQVVWGARTLAGSTQASDWLYISVRRLMCFLEDSITTGTAWAVFEPNDERLWSALRRNIGAFLTEQWRHGALKGTTPAEAYYVQCDETTNPDDQIRQGILTCHIGVAPVRPAEFLRFTIQQLAPQPTA